MRELRCKICNKLLFKHSVKEGELSIKCLKCKTISIIDFTVEFEKRNIVHGTTLKQEAEKTL